MCDCPQEKALREREAALADWACQEGGWRLFHYATTPPPPDTFDLTDRINPDVSPRLRAILVAARTHGQEVGE